MTTIILDNDGIESFKIYPNSGTLIYRKNSTIICYIKMNGMSKICINTNIQGVFFTYMFHNHTIFYANNDQLVSFDLNSSKILHTVKSEFKIYEMESIGDKLGFILHPGIYINKYILMHHVKELIVIEQKKLPTNLCGCSHLCIFVGTEVAECRCPVGMSLSLNGLSCSCNEKNCSKSCLPHEYMCMEDLSCMHNRIRCDSVIDCLKGSDEFGCIYKCNNDEFSCLDGLKCIPEADRCNNVYDCNDHSDESGCEKNNSIPECKKHQFSCHNHRCVNNDTICDGRDDCGDFSDEICKECSINEFSCDDHFCIPISKVCDYHFDCYDRADEIKCSHKYKYNKSSSKMIDGNLICNKSHPDKDRNVSNLQICNHISDCINGYDEKLCEYFQKCPNKNTKCISDNRCYKNSSICDGIRDCPEGEDEICDDENICNQNNTFACKNLWCINSSKLCDGIDDCEDSSDEFQDCNESNAIVFLDVIEERNKLLVDYILLNNINKDTKLSLNLFILMNLKESHIINLTISDPKKIDKIELNIDLFECTVYKLVITLQSKIQINREIQFRSLYHLKIPNFLVIHRKELSWEYNVSECSLRIFYIECESKFDNRIYYFFSNKKKYSLPNVSFLTCKVAFCPTSVFNISCGPFSDTMYIDYKSKNISLITNLLTMISLIVIEFVTWYCVDWLNYCKSILYDCLNKLIHKIKYLFRRRTIISKVISENINFMEDTDF